MASNVATDDQPIQMSINAYRLLITFPYFTPLVTSYYPLVTVVPIFLTFARKLTCEPRYCDSPIESLSLL